MNLHEYQGKLLFAQYGLPVSKGYAVSSAKEAVEAADTIGGKEWVVKAQVHAGGRGKAGGVKLVKTKDEIKEVFLQVGVYCGVPAAVDAFRSAREVFAEMKI